MTCQDRPSDMPNELPCPGRPSDVAGTPRMPIVAGDRSLPDLVNLQFQVLEPLRLDLLLAKVKRALGHIRNMSS